ncbi:MAG TPA: rhodanese-like domain-containing protein [archaeon]|nr:rhodanese-like domain-containing protein [archaeon]
MQSRIMLVGTMALILVFGAIVPLVAGTRFPEVTVDQAQELIHKHTRDATFVIMDVRTPQEFADGHLSGAMNVNVMAPDFERQLGALDRGKTYLVYCRTGNRSAQAIRVLERLGFRSVYHMFEGIVGWQKKAFPLVKSS